MFIFALAASVFGGSASAGLLGALSVHDQNQKRPLLDAIGKGFVAVEVDVRLEDGQIWLDRKGAEKQSLVSAYLDPLKQRAAGSQGMVYAGGPTFTLFIHAKKDAAAVGRALTPLLSDYREILTSHGPNGRVDKGLTIVFENSSGPTGANEPYFREGRFSDFGLGEAKSGIDYFADSWMLQVRWLGIGPISIARSQAAIDFIRKARALGKYVRFTGTPDVPEVWGFLSTNDVDFIGTENLESLADYLERHPMKPRPIPPKMDGGGLFGKVLNVLG